MSDNVLSPNMSLPIPVVGISATPQYALDVDQCFTTIDGHDHTAGSGVLITPSAININSSLPMNNNVLSSPSAIIYQVQSADAASFSSYMKGVDFYLRDGSGNVIRLTQSGSIAGASGTITGLPSGTASASFAAGVFTFQSATSTPANISMGSALLGNNTTSGFALTLSPPTLGSNYTLTLPTVPAQTNVMTLDSSGNMGSVANQPLADTLGQAMTHVGANPVANARTRPLLNDLVAGAIQYTSSSGSFTTASTSFVAVTNLSLNITTSGRPVMLILTADGGSANSLINATSIFSAIQIVNNSLGGQVGVVSIAGPTVCITMVDTAVSGIAAEYTYNVQAKADSGDVVSVKNIKLVAYEL